MKRLLINLIVSVIVDSATTKNLFFSQLQVVSTYLPHYYIINTTTITLEDRIFSNTLEDTANNDFIFFL